MKNVIVIVLIIVLSVSITSCNFNTPICYEDWCYSDIGYIYTYIDNDVGGAWTSVLLMKLFSTNLYYLQLETELKHEYFYAYLTNPVFSLADSNESDRNKQVDYSVTIRDGDSVKMVLEKVYDFFKDYSIRDKFNQVHYSHYYMQRYLISKEQIISLKNFKNLNIGPFFVRLIEPVSGAQICCKESGKFELDSEELQIFINYVLENP